MSAAVLARLRSETMRRTKSDVLIANFLERNLSELPFETAKSIAGKVGVSQMTVGRFLRRLGGFEELKRDIRGGATRTAWQVRGKFDRLQDDIRHGNLLAELIRRQMDDLASLYDLTVTPEWSRAVRALAEADEVFVAAFQNVRGVAQYFAAQLSYARPRVEFVDGLNGTYVELLDAAPRRRCLFLYDVRRFARKARVLADEARRVGMTVVLVSDDACVWAREAADVAILMPGAKGPLWDGAATTVALFDLLIANIVVELGQSVNERVDRLTRLQDRFGDFED